MYTEGMGYSAISRVLVEGLEVWDRPVRARYSSDAYGVYGYLPMNKHSVSKGGVVNRNEGCIRHCAAS